MDPKVSAIIPTYNRAASVQNSINSVLAQTFNAFEIIVVDDGSSDATGDILPKSYGDQIRYFYQPNRGISGARNRGIAEARGEWIAFLDSDDIWESKKLELQMDALHWFGPDCGACYTDLRLINHSETRTLFEMVEKGDRHEGERGINKEVLRMLVRPGGAGMVVCPSSLVARTDLVRNVGGLNPELRYQADTEFMFRLALLTSFCYVSRPLVGFDRSPAETRHIGVTAEWNKVEFILRDSQVWLEGLLNLGKAVPPDVRKLIREVLSAVHSGLANCYLETGSYGEARAAISRAVRTNLTFNVALKWLLTNVSPGLALQAVHRYQARARDSAPFI